MLTLYYEAMGWDPKEGVPTRELAELNLHGWMSSRSKNLATEGTEMRFKKAK